MAKIPIVTSRRLVAALEKLGFYSVRQSGSHLQLKRGNLLVTVPIHSGDLTRQVVKSVLRQAHLTVEELRRVL